MKHIAVSLLTFLLGLASVHADESTVAEFSWQQLAQAGQLKTGSVVTLPDKSVALRVENAGPDPLQANLLTIEKPQITTDFYAVTGEVRYENVAGDGFLEMWSHFEPSGAYFSRTLGEFGPMGKLRGTSDWRPFTLHFNAAGAKSHPSKLVINLHLPGKGVVYLRSLKLVQSSRMGMLSPQSGAWWSDRGAALIGGIGGALLGCLGSLLEWCAKRGKSRTFVVVSCRAMIGVGAVAIVTGLLALLLHQSYGVWYVLLLLGVLCILIFPFRLRRYQEHYRSIELRRMSSLDLA